MNLTPTSFFSVLPGAPPMGGVPGVPAAAAAAGFTQAVDAALAGAPGMLVPPGPLVARPENAAPAGPAPVRTASTGAAPTGPATPDPATPGPVMPSLVPAQGWQGSAASAWPELAAIAPALVEAVPSGRAAPTQPAPAAEPQPLLKAPVASTLAPSPQAAPAQAFPMPATTPAPTIAAADRVGQTPETTEPAPEEEPASDTAASDERAVAPPAPDLPTPAPSAPIASPALAIALRPAPAPAPREASSEGDEVGAFEPARPAGNALVHDAAGRDSSAGAANARPAPTGFADRVAAIVPEPHAPAQAAGGDAVTPVADIARAQLAAAPASAPSAEPAPSMAKLPEPVVTARAGQIGHEMGVEIARRVSAGGDELTVRLNPVEMGRIEVRLAFDERGSLRAVVAAESPAALDLLRRDSADLGRALADAGVRSDAQSFRFDARAGGGDGGQPWQRQRGGQDGGQGSVPGRGYADAGSASEELLCRPLRTSGRVDLMA